jgi:flagellar biosynthesis/type III secretory pathway protein FliH
MKRKDIFLTEELDAIFRKRNSAALIAEGEAKGKAEGKAEGRVKETETARNMVLTVLRARFGKVTKGIEKEIHQISDLIALASWAAQAATCESLKEFEEALR